MLSTVRSRTRRATYCVVGRDSWAIFENDRERTHSAEYSFALRLLGDSFFRGCVLMGPVTVLLGLFCCCCCVRPAASLPRSGLLFITFSSCSFLCSRLSGWTSTTLVPATSPSLGPRLGAEPRFPVGLCCATRTLIASPPFAATLISFVRFHTLFNHRIDEHVG